jgi:starvation-inducible DNA-binding protein
MESHHPTELVERLRHEQANAVQLYLLYKGYHWNVRGAQFHDLHLMFDDHAKQVLDMVDPLAERQRILGAPAHYDLDALGRSSQLAVDAHLPGSGREMVERLVESHRHIIRNLKAGFELSSELHDPGTADLFTRCLVAHEKLEWFLREILDSRAELFEGLVVGPTAVRGHGLAPTGVA